MTGFPLARLRKIFVVVSRGLGGDGPKFKCRCKLSRSARRASGAATNVTSSVQGEREGLRCCQGQAHEDDDRSQEIREEGDQDEDEGL